MLAVAGGRGDLLLSRDAHKSVVAGLVFSGVQPRWIRPRYDERLHLAHPPSPRQVEQAWREHPDAAGAVIVSPAPACPSTRTRQLEPARLPRDAFFAAKETITAHQAVGRICAEQITPYPAGHPSLGTIRVVTQADPGA
jgi:arginine/lysine/ornithine decarboxylase